MTCCKTYKSKLSYSNRIMPSLSERSNKLWRNFLQYAEAKSRWRPDIIYRTQLRSNQSSRSSKKLIKTLSSCSQPRCGEQSGKVDESVQGALTTPARWPLLLGTTLRSSSLNHNHISLFSSASAPSLPQNLHSPCLLGNSVLSLYI